MADKNHIFSHLSLSTHWQKPKFLLNSCFFPSARSCFHQHPWKTMVKRNFCPGNDLTICDGQVEYALQKQDPFSSQLMQFCVLNLLSSTVLLKLNGTDYEVWRNMSSWVPNIQDASNQTWFNPAPDTGSQESGVSDRHTNRRGNLRSVFAALATCSNIVLPIEDCYGNYWMV